MRLFAPGVATELGLRVAGFLGRGLDEHEERDFANGEHKLRPLVDVQGEDAVVLYSLHGDRALSVNDKLCRAAFFVGALRDAGARSVTLVAPYLAYSRKDRRSKARDPVTTRYVATMLESVGVDRLLTVDVHNPAAFDNSFRRPAVNLSTTGLFAEHFVRRYGAGIDVIVAPDLGGLKATRLFVDAFATLRGAPVPMAAMDKRRSQGIVSGSGLLGRASGHVLIVDDMIGSGTTLCRAVTACLEDGAERVSVAATHGLFEGGAVALFDQPGIDSITVTNTVAIESLGLPAEHLARVTKIDVAPLLADCLRSLLT
jgi:ribose-phosphate pyrophosphokinase